LTGRGTATIEAAGALQVGVPPAARSAAARAGETRSVLAAG